MTKKQNKLIVWMIVWAGLLIVVLYSPIGSPDLYSPPNYHIYKPFVSADNEGILNAPKNSLKEENNSNDTEIPDVSSGPVSNYVVGNYQSSNEGMNGSSNTGQPQSYQNYNASELNNSGGGSASFLAVSSRGSAGSTGVTMSNGTNTMSLTSNFNSNMTKQSSVAYVAGTGGTDPGGDPTGDPIPVGDGWGIFLILGILYALIKKVPFSANKI